eukprot:11101569-Lingulodinium_polyedra.AAC.1
MGLQKRGERRQAAALDALEVEEAPLPHHRRNGGHPVLPPNRHVAELVRVSAVERHAHRPAQGAHLGPLQLPALRHGDAVEELAVA